MTIKQHGGIFGRNPKFNNVEAESLSIAGNAVPDASTILVDGDIGSTVQGYDADTAKYDDATANFTGTLQNGGSNVVVDTDIGSTVQAYDADTAKLDTAQTFTAEQTFNENLIFAASKGINFAAAGSDGPSVDAELLDDYEEGRWTPEFESTGTNPTFIAGANQRGAYTKIGNQVFFSLFMSRRIATAGTGGILITGLPFTASIRFGFVDQCACSISDWSDWTTRPDLASIDGGTNEIALFTFGTASGPVALPTSAFKFGSANDNRIVVTGCYFTDA